MNFSFFFIKDFFFKISFKLDLVIPCTTSTVQLSYGKPFGILGCPEFEQQGSNPCRHLEKFELTEMHVLFINFMPTIITIM